MNTLKDPSEPHSCNEKKNTPDKMSLFMISTEVLGDKDIPDHHNVVKHHRTLSRYQ